MIPKRYEDLGVSRLALMQGFEAMSLGDGADALEAGLAFVEKTAETLQLG